MGIGQAFVRRLLMGGQDIHQCAVMFLADGLIEGQLPTAQPLVHFNDIAFTHIQAVSQQFAVRRKSFPFEFGLFFFRL